MSSREKFEAWWESERYDDKLKSIKGILFNRIKANMFIAWQASRDEEIELPEPFKLAKSSSGLEYYYADEVDDAILDAGFKVKGG